MPAEPEPEGDTPEPVPSIDGGARRDQPPATPTPTEAEFYTALFETARRGGGGW